MVVSTKMCRGGNQSALCTDRSSICGCVGATDLVVET
jgi:hypothetical protein